MCRHVRLRACGRKRRLGRASLIRRLEEARPLPAAAKTGLEGVYAFEAGAGNFGINAAGRWSYTVTGTDTVFHFSLFCADEVTCNSTAK